MSASANLRSLIEAKGLVEAMASHSVLSARLASEAGFDAIWASGFELSALYGLPDASLVSMTQHLEMTRAMAERGGLPIIADIDTGYGNAINTLYAVDQYRRADAAALVIEDKSFPKMTSLIAGGRQELVRIEEFQGKIEAACHAAGQDGPIIVARTEALIAGLGQEEALKRAAAYEEAGAELILIHSKAKTPDEIVAFITAWQGKAKLVVVPTSYPTLDVQRLRALGKVAITIYGNHAIRASSAAMKAVFAAIKRDGCAAGVSETIDSVEEIFRLQDMDKVKEDETRFLR